MVEAKLSKPLSEETKENISTKMRGRNLCEEHKTNLSLSKKKSKKNMCLKYSYKSRNYFWFYK